MRKLIILAAGGTLLVGCATSQGHMSADSTLGSERRPVRANMPRGQHAYLGRLRCADAAPPRFERAGSVGDAADGHIMDLYDVRCFGSQPAETAIYMDMYHRGYVEDKPVPGFTIVPR